MRLSTRQVSFALVCALSLAMAASVGARADENDDDDHGRARSAVQQGQALSLDEVLRRVRPVLGGDVVGVELDRKAGRYVYELKIVSASGRLREVYVDALTTEILQDD